MKPYLESAEDVLKEVNSTEDGLSPEEAAARLEKHGKNKLAEAEKEGLFKKFMGSLADPMIIMLLVAALVQAAVTVFETVKAGNGAHFSDFADVLVILVVVIVELAAYFIGFYMENKTLTGCIFTETTCVNAMAMAFLTVNFAEMFCAVNMRSQLGSIFSKDMFRKMNWWLVGAFVVTSLLTLMAIYTPGLQEVFDIKPGTFQLNELLLSLLLAASTIPVFELGKAIRRKTAK